MGCQSSDSVRSIRTYSDKFVEIDSFEDLYLRKS